MADRSSNGTLVRPAPPPEGEIGSAAGQNRLFSVGVDGKLLTPRDVTADSIDEMLKLDGKGRALEQILTLPIRFATWTIDPAAGDHGEAEFVRDALTRPDTAGGMSTPIDLLIAQAASACLYRRAFFEKVWKVNTNDRFVYDKIAFRPARTCQVIRDPDDYSFQGIRQWVRKGTSLAAQVTIPPVKALVFIHGQHRQPLDGISDLDTSLQVFESKQKVRWLWYSFLENQTLPKAIATDESNDPNQAATLARKVATLKGGGVVGITGQQKVEKFESSGAGAAVFKEALTYLDSEMSGSVLAGFLDLTSHAGSGKGSFALSKDQSDLFLQGREAVLSELAATLRTWVVAPLVLYNFGTKAAVPNFTFGPLVEGLGGADQAVSLLQALSTSQQPLSPLVPREFIDLLIEKVAEHLGLDTGRVAEAIKTAQDQQPAGPAGQLRAGIDAATRLMMQAGAGIQPVAA